MVLLHKLDLPCIPLRIREFFAEQSQLSAQILVPLHKVLTPQYIQVCIRKDLFEQAGGRLGQRGRQDRPADNLNFTVSVSKGWQDLHRDPSADQLVVGGLFHIPDVVEPGRGEQQRERFSLYAFQAGQPFDRRDDFIAGMCDPMIEQRR